MFQRVQESETKIFISNKKYISIKTIFQYKYFALIQGFMYIVDRKEVIISVNNLHKKHHTIKNIFHIKHNLCEHIIQQFVTFSA